MLASTTPPSPSRPSASMPSAILSPPFWSRLLPSWLSTGSHSRSRANDWAKRSGSIPASSPSGSFQRSRVRGGMS